MSAVRWCSVRHRETGNKNPVIADGVVCVRFCREMDSDNNAPCFSLVGLVLHQFFRRGYKNCL